MGGGEPFPVVCGAPQGQHGRGDLVQGRLLIPLGLVSVDSHLCCTNASISLLPGPTEFTVTRLVETPFSEHLGNQFYDSPL